MLADPPAGREKIRSFAVVIEDVPCTPQVQSPMGVLAAAGLGTLNGALTGVGIAAYCTAPLLQGSNDEFSAFIAAVVFVGVAAVAIPVCTIGGAFVGGDRAMPADEVARRVAAVERSLKAAPQACGLGHTLPAALRNVRWQLHAVDPERADARITVRPVTLGLLGGHGIDPEVAVVVEVEVTWTTSDAVHHQRWQYRGPSHPLTVWSDEPARIRAELSIARQELATRIAEELLLVEVVR